MKIDKSAFLHFLINLVQGKLNEVHKELEQLRFDMSSDTKSTAGDKHETSRAMAQMEMEKLGKQSIDYQKQLQLIQQLAHGNESPHNTIQAGTLVELSNGYFFLGIPLGKVAFEGNDVFCLSLQSPLGQQLVGKKNGQEIILPNLTVTIEGIY